MDGLRGKKQKIKTGKEGKWSIINFACDLVRFLRFHSIFLVDFASPILRPQQTLTTTFCKKLFRSLMSCLEAFL